MTAGSGGTGFASVQAHRIWVVDEPVKSVMRYLRAHAPTSQRSNWKFGASWGPRPVPGRTGGRGVRVDVRELPGGETLVMAFAQDEWIEPPAKPVLPGSVKRVDITSGYPGERTLVHMDVHDPRLVATLVSWVNGLGVDQEPSAPCSGTFSQFAGVTLTFRDQNGSLLAEGKVGADPWSAVCDPLYFTAQGHAAQQLLGGNLVPRIERLLHADFSPPVPRYVSLCLRHRGWSVRPASGGLEVRRGGLPTAIIFHPTGKVTTAGTRWPMISDCLREATFLPYMG